MCIEFHLPHHEISNRLHSNSSAAEKFASKDKFGNSLALNVEKRYLDSFSSCSMSCFCGTKMKQRFSYEPGMSCCEYFFLRCMKTRELFKKQEKCFSVLDTKLQFGQKLCRI